MVMTRGWFMKLCYTHILMGFWGFTILILIGVTTLVDGSILPCPWPHWWMMRPTSPNSPNPPRLLRPSRRCLWVSGPAELHPESQVLLPCLILAVLAIHLWGYIGFDQESTAIRITHGVVPACPHIPICGFPHGISTKTQQASPCGRGSGRYSPVASRWQCVRKRPRKSLKVTAPGIFSWTSSQKATR